MDCRIDLNCDRRPFPEGESLPGAPIDTRHPSQQGKLPSILNDDVTGVRHTHAEIAITFLEADFLTRLRAQHEALSSPQRLKPCVPGQVGPQADLQALDEAIAGQEQPQILIFKTIIRYHDKITGLTRRSQDIGCIGIYGEAIT